jgi:hypothetical protein
MTSPRALLLAFAAFAAVLTACGDDGGGSVAAYCDIADELNAQEGDPTDEQLDQVASAAPSEIKSEVKTIVDAIKSDDEAAFEDEDLLAAGEKITTFTDENCGNGDADAEADSDSEE